MFEIKKKIKELNEKTVVTRDMIQEICLDFKEKPDLSVFLAHAPRVGKTKSTLNVLYGEKVLFVSNTTLIRNNWEFSALGYSNFKSICWQNAKNELDIYETIVIDELDSMDSENNLELFKNFHPKRWIFLTGTKDAQSVKFAQALAGEFLMWDITSQQAIDWGILPPPKIYAIGIDLGTSIKNCLYEKGKDKSKISKTVSFGEYLGLKNKSGTNFNVLCTEKEYETLVTGDQSYWKRCLDELYEYRKLKAIKVKNLAEEERLEELSKYENFIPEHIIKQMLNVCGNKRKKFFAEKKLRYLMAFLGREKIKGKRCLIFVDSAKQADVLHEECDINPTYAALGKTGLSNIKKFQEMEISRLSCVNQLNRGVDLTNIDFGILLQCANSPNENKQKASRMFLDAFPMIVVFYFKGTKDEEYVKKFCSLYKEEYTTYVNFKDLN